VANAVGAVLGQVAQRVHITVTQPVRGIFKVFTPSGPVDFRLLDEALAHARALAADEARARALAAGAAGCGHVADLVAVVQVPAVDVVQGERHPHD
jgi:hypothetical protein